MKIKLLMDSDIVSKVELNEILDISWCNNLKLTVNVLKITNKGVSTEILCLWLNIFEI